MPTTIQENEFFSVGEVLELIGVDRTTLWRWKREGKVPSGRRFRGNQILFTAEEVKKIEEYAFRLEPIHIPNPEQLRLFDGKEAAK